MSPGFHSPVQGTGRIPRVLLVDDGDTALAYLFGRADRDRESSTLPDLLLLDLNLPGSDRFALLSAVRADPQLESLPVNADLLSSD